MAIVELPIGDGFYKSSSLPAASQECLNWYPRIPEAPALTPVQMHGTPGLTQVATSGAGANRGGHEMNGIAYFVAGTSLYRLNSDETLDNLGTIEGAGRVWMADNGTQLCILSPGGKGYIFVEPGTLTEITDGDFRANGEPLAVCYVDSYFVFTTDEKKFIISAVNDGLAYDALDFGSADSSPDGALVPVVVKNQLFIVGEITTEAFQNIGGPDFPFQRSGLFLDQGTTAAFSVVRAPGTFLFVGCGENQSSGVYQLDGNSTVKVSTAPIDDLLQALSSDDLATVYAVSYGLHGHHFAAFTLPATTIVYDATTGIWHERRSRYLVGDDITEFAWRVSSVVKAYGVLHAADTVDGRIGALSPDTYTEYGNLIKRIMSTRPWHNKFQPFFVPYLELTVESGVGNDEDPNPRIILEISKDGGKTFPYFSERPMGAEGEYGRRTIWRRRVGRVERFVAFRFILSAPVKPVILALTADIREANDAAA